MEHNFLNKEMSEANSGRFLNEGVVTKFHPSFEDKFLLENNIEVLSDLFDFLGSDEKIFVLNGFMGSGKTTLINYLKEALKNDVLVFKMNYFAATNLDDLLLGLFADFANYHSEHKIQLPKIVTPIFTEKIHAFIKAVDAPMLFILDSFDNTVVLSENQKNILDFIKYLSKIEKIKIIIASRSFDVEDIDGGIAVNYSMTKLLNNEKFENLLVQNKLNENSFYVEQAFKYTKGHYLYASMMVNIMSLLHITLSDLLNEFSKRNKQFNEFLVFKILDLVPDRFLKLLCFLSLIRHGVEDKFIIEQNFATKEDIDYLKSRMILTSENNFVYLKDYVKNEILKNTDEDVRIKIHSYLSELYDSQLPKKPSERELVISRGTMRDEIEYHNQQVQKLNKTAQNKAEKNADNVNFNYLNYLNTSGYDKPIENIVISKKVEPKKIEKSVKPEKTRRFELSNDELALLNTRTYEEDEIIKSVNDKMPLQNYLEQKSKNEKEVIPSHKESLEDWIQIAQSAEEQFDYTSAILSYKKALEMKTDSMFDIKKPLIVTKLAICYKKAQNKEKALQHFEEVYQIYQTTEPIKANSILLSIAQIYNESYKFSDAQRIYEKIISSKTKNPPELMVRALLDLSELSDNNSNSQQALAYCQKALIEAEKTDDAKLISEAYFKYALSMDDSGKLDVAAKYYAKCINTLEDSSTNEFLSSAYSNLASILSEQNDTEKAIKYYELSIEVDKIQNNYEGLYFGYSKLAHIFQIKNPQKSLDFMVKSLSAARRLDDKFFAASAYLDLGDFYYNRKINEKALKAYLAAKQLITKQPNEENMQRVKARIDDLRFKLGAEKYIEIIDSFKKG
ncbi:MAG: tetratricopeptide repeat protein [Candidatus Gastranaerophilales bacterium]|nr:tetratricopeptide repeat protein [Candidatus Gastranaerophilales bacterium]